MRVAKPFPVPALARLLPALLCALCVFLVPPASAAAGTGSPTATAAVAPAPRDHTEPGAVERPARFAAPPDGPTAAPEPLTASPDTRVAAAETVELPAVVEQSVRFTAPPVAPPAVRGAAEVPGRGRAEGDPRRERAPPGLPYDPTAPRGPPSTRHS
ncbi:hypothetical protein ACFY9F_08340 [Streptomyces sp. NPDC012421]|uniref:hypothetical protein n=1 Tax=Streptomyces sp. NPDC012421 TaxID=3364832 RepID=UPI0036E19D29